MQRDNHSQPWPRPEAAGFQGRYVQISRLDPARDLDDLYAVSHGSAEAEALWYYLWYGPFESRDAMRDWLCSIANSPDPRFYAVRGLELNRTVGMLSILNIAPEMGRAELGHIWYGPVAQKTRINTETIFLFLRYLFDDLGYRRVEWKCDNANAESKRAARRLGFQFEGVFRQHMLVKGRNRDTAWFSIIDGEWPALRAKFEKYLASDDLSLTALNRGATG